MQNAEKIRVLLELNTRIIRIIEENKFFHKDTYNIVKESLNSINEKLTNKKYSVAVIAAMKAGKSTLFNSILGEDILPNESAACTVSMTEIKHSQNNLREVIKIYKDGKKEIIKANNNESLQEVFLRDIRTTREQGKVQDIKKYFLEHKIEALNNSVYDGLVENFTLIDTPGPNEANNGDFDTRELKETTYYQLRNADAIIFVLDYSSYKSETNAKLLKDIFEGREDIAKDNDKIFFILNKIDYRSEKDRDIEEIIRDIKQFISYNTGNIITNPNVIGISALMALYGRGISNNSLSEKQIQSCEEKYTIKYSKKENFNGRMVFVPPTLEELGENLLKDSNILEFENKVIIDTFIKSSSKMIEGTNELIKNKLEFASDDIISNIVILDKGIQELQQEIIITKNEINKILEDSRVVFNEIERNVANLNNELKQNVKSLSSEARDVIDRNLSTYQDLYESTDKMYLDNISNNINISCRQAMESFVLRKQDEFIRQYSKYRGELNIDLYKAVNELSRRVDVVIKKNLDINIETAAMVNFGVEGANYQGDIEKYNTENELMSDEEFVSQTKRGAAFAANGAAVGLSLGGPIGALVGGVAGFLVGIGSHKSSEPIRRLTTYKLDTTEIKSKLKSFYIEESVKLENGFDEYLLKETNVIKDTINKVLSNFQEQINIYLDGLVIKFEEEKDKRQASINELKKLNEEIESLKAQLIGR